MPPQVCFSGCSGLHDTFKVRVDKPLAWEWEAMMPAVPGDSVGQKQEYGSPVLVGKEREQGNLNAEPLKALCRWQEMQKELEDFHGI